MSQTTSTGQHGAGLKDHEAQIDMVALRRYRLDRLHRELARRDYGGCVLYDPINVRYATGSRNMSLHCMHTPSRCAMVVTQGPVILFEYRKSEHLAEGLESIDEIRPCVSWNYFSAGPNREARGARWADGIANVVAEHCGRNRRIAFDHLDPLGYELITARNIEIVDGQEPIEHARSIKSAEEIACMEASIAVCEAGMARMHEALRPGLSENALWAILHEVNIANGGE
ncbi:MAG: M24 family metallopeptidase, partial [Gammaproteobacteria bacterium]